MKLKLTETFIGKLRAGEIPVSVERPYPGTKTTAANYLLYDETPGTPSGFALRVGKNSATYILDTVVGGKKTKITIGLAKGNLFSMHLGKKEAFKGPKMEMSIKRRNFIKCLSIERVCLMQRNLCCIPS